MRRSDIGVMVFRASKLEASLGQLKAELQKAELAVEGRGDLVEGQEPPAEVRRWVTYM